MNAEDETREIPLDVPEEDGDAQPEPDLGPWGAEAVQLGEQSGDRAPIGASACRPEATPRRWTTLAAVVCAASVFSALGALILGGGSTTEKSSSQKTPKTNRQPLIAERLPNGTRAAHRARQRRRPARRQAPHRHSTAQPHATHPAPSPTYPPPPASAPAPEPVAPSPAPAPAPEPRPTTRPSPASGPTVAREFGFER